MEQITSTCLGVFTILAKSPVTRLWLRHRSKSRRQSNSVLLWFCSFFIIICSCALSPSFNFISLLRLLSFNDKRERRHSPLGTRRSPLALLFLLVFLYHSRVVYIHTPLCVCVCVCVLPLALCCYFHAQLFSNNVWSCFIICFDYQNCRFAFSGRWPPLARRSSSIHSRSGASCRCRKSRRAWSNQTALKMPLNIELGIILTLT